MSYLKKIWKTGSLWIKEETKTYINKTVKKEGSQNIPVSKKVTKSCHQDTSRRLIEGPWKRSDVLRPKERWRNFGLQYPGPGTCSKERCPDSPLAGAKKWRCVLFHPNRWVELLFFEKQNATLWWFAPKQFSKRSNTYHMFQPFQKPNFSKTTRISKNIRHFSFSPFLFTQGQQNPFFLVKTASRRHFRAQTSASSLMPRINGAWDRTTTCASCSRRRARRTRSVSSSRWWPKWAMMALGSEIPMVSWKNEEKNRLFERNPFLKSRFDVVQKKCRTMVWSDHLTQASMCRLPFCRICRRSSMVSSASSSVRKRWGQKVRVRVPMRRFWMWGKKSGSWKGSRYRRRKRVFMIIGSPPVNKTSPQVMMAFAKRLLS